MATIVIVTYVQLSILFTIGGATVYNDVDDITYVFPSSANF